MDVGYLLLGGFFGTIGIVLVFIGRKFWGRYRAVTGTPTTDVRQVDERGIVELKGTVKPAEDSVTSSLGGVSDTVVAGWMARD